MIKVRFDVDNAKEVHYFNDKVVTVTLTGRITEDSFNDFPFSIIESMYLSDNPRFYHSVANNSEIVTVQGKAMKTDGDSFDPVVGERIAEGRAKLKLYNTIKSIAKKYIQYHMETIMGKNDEERIDWVNILSHNYSYPCSIMQDYIKYEKLATKEREHLEELIEQANN